MNWTKEQLKKMQEVDVTTVDRDSLVDLKDIVIDEDKPVEEKIRQFCEQTDNPYVNKIDEYVVKVAYADTDFTIDDKLKAYINKLGELDY